MFSKLKISAKIRQFWQNYLPNRFTSKNLNNNQVVIFINDLIRKFSESVYMITPPLILNCFEYKRRLEGGLSKPFLFAANDENNKEYEVVVKLRKPDSENNHFGATSLACELICSIVLRLLDIPTPNYAIVFISETLAASHLIQSDRKLLIANKGKNFGTIFHKGATTWYPNSEATLTDTQYNLVEDVMTFDSTVINGDRKIDKPNILQTGKEVLLIDHSLALPVCRWNSKDIDDSPLFPDANIKAHCGFNPMRSKIKDDTNMFGFSKLLSNWDAVLSDEDWKTIRDFIPSSWEENHGELDKIFRFLQKRPERFIEISESLRRIVR